MLQRLLTTAILAGLVAFWAGPASAGVFHSRDEALELAFPGAERITPRDFYLTPEQRSEIEHLAKGKLDSGLLTVYIGYRGEEVLGYAILDTHLVRTLPETFLIVLTRDGSVSATHLLAFYEPPEFSPSGRWLEQFSGKSLSDNLDVGRGIAAITGSTLTSRAVAGGVRRALAIYKVLLGAK